MTFSLVARDPDTGSFGIAISSSSPAVAARCVHLAPRVGAAVSQNVTNPELGSMILTALREGSDAEAALASALRGDPYPDFRQAIVVDALGRVTVHSGSGALGIDAHAVGPGAAAAGNMLATDQVPQRMIDAYAAGGAMTLEERLLAGLLAGLAEGGEAGPVRSAGLAVVDQVSWRTTDLRVDDHDEPIGELGRLLGIWLPQKQDYLTRALNPVAAAPYRVAGDEGA